MFSLKFHPHQVVLKKLCMLCAMALITSCSIFSTKNKDNKPKPIDVIILSSSEINPNLFDRPSPLKIRFFQLEKNDVFIDLDYFELEHSKKIGEELVEITHTILRPDNLKHMSFKLTDKTKYIGVIGAFRDIENSQWRRLFLKQPYSYGHAFDNYLYIKVDIDGIHQLSKKEMGAELVNYHTKHPKDTRVNKRGKFKKPKADYSKGIFLEN